MRRSARRPTSAVATIAICCILVAETTTVARGAVRHVAEHRTRSRAALIVPRKSPIRNPSSSEAPIPPGGVDCANLGLGVIAASPDNSATCIAGALAAIDNSRVNEELAPLSFDLGAFEAMPASEQIFAITNLERISRGLAPALYLTAQLDRAAQLGANSSQDPNFPLSLTGGAVPVLRTSNWQGGDSNVLWADDTWMYDDGFGSSNADCTSPGSNGCWVHRADTLVPDPQPGCFLAMGAAAKGLSFADMLIEGCGAPPTDQVLAWPTVTRALSGNGRFAISTQVLVAPDSFAADYSNWMAAENESGPLTWDVVSGSLPPGYSLSSSGHLTGPVSSLTGTFTFSLKVTASRSQPRASTSSFSLAFGPAGTPSAPTNLVAIPQDGSALLTWAAASARGGPRAEGYTVSESYSAPHGCATTSDAETSCVVTGLKNGHPYVFTVASSTATGSSEDSAPSNVVWPASTAAMSTRHPVISVSSRRLRLSFVKRRIAITLGCAVTNCSGILKLTEVVPLTVSATTSSISNIALRAAPTTASLVLASAAYRLAAGKRSRVDLVLTSAGIAQLLKVSSATPIKAHITISLRHGRTLQATVELSRGATRATAAPAAVARWNSR